MCRCANTLKANGTVPKDQMVRYEDIAKATFGDAGKRIISAIMYTELVGTCALLLILEGDNLWNLMRPQVQAYGASALGGLGRWMTSSICAFWLGVAIVVPTVLAPDVKTLSFLGLCGFTATLTVTLAVATVLFTGAQLTCG